MPRLRWKQDGYLHFAHSKIGMWTIEQCRGKFLLTLGLAGLSSAVPDQDMGSHSSLAKAKAQAERDDRALSKLD